MAALREMKGRRPKLDLQANSAYLARRECQCAHPIPEHGGGLHCVLCGKPLDHMRAVALSGRPRHPHDYN